MFRRLNLVVLVLGHYVTSVLGHYGPAPPEAQQHDDNDELLCREGRQCHLGKQGSHRCGLYLAQSTIPNSGLGVFTGIPRPVGSIVAPPEIGHSIILETGQGGPNGPPDSWSQSLAHQYTWEASASGSSFEAKSSETLIPGHGMNANSFTSLVNARSLMGSIDSAGINYVTSDPMEGEPQQHYSKSPGSGAFSYYHGITYIAERPMEAGSEVFVDYGDRYFRDRMNVYGMLPLQKEFEKADKMMKALWRSLPASVKDGEIGPEWQAAWNAIRKEFVTNKRIRNALPASIEEIPRAVELGLLNHFLRGENPRTLEWLEQNGLCLDNIEAGTSDIPHAGRGAFAKRSFAAGEMLHPLPLMQIPRQMLYLYEQGQNNVIAGHQLLLNYCFGHKASSVLLFPYSSTSNFINHGGRNANSKLIWANSATDPMGYHHEGSMKQSAEQVLHNRASTSLLMLLVATRDISEGEEVTIDYGSEWEEAWLQHVSSWSSAGNDQKTAAEYNESELQIRTIFEEPYPSSIETACHYRYNDAEVEGYVERHSIYRGGDSARHRKFDDDSLEQLKSKLPSIEQHALPWFDVGGVLTMSGDHLRPCTILMRDSNDMYTVRMYNRDNMHDWMIIPPNVELYMKNVPRKAIIFVDQAGASDQHLWRAFRHEIGFPDADTMWPDAWKYSN